MKKLLFFFLLLSQIATAQDISVLKNELILSADSEYCFPHFSSDGEKVAFTTPNYVGLYIMDIKSKKMLQISDKQGAGYEPVFSDDGSTIYYRWNEYEGMRKYAHIYSKNLHNKGETIIESRKRNLSAPQFINDKLIYTLDNAVKKIPISGKTDLGKGEDIWIGIENQSIVVYENDEKRVLAPIGVGNYIWPELSPDKTKILFTFAGRGTYVSDLDGNILTELGYLNASKWLNDEWIVGMKDFDDGNVITGSDLFVVKADGSGFTHLTQTEDKFEMYPDCSPNSTKVVYHTLDGDIYLMTLKLK